MIRIFRFYENHSLDKVNAFFENEAQRFIANPQEFKERYGYNYS